MRLEDKVAIVTGSSQGIGEGVALASAEGDFITGQCLNVDGGWALY